MKKLKFILIALIFAVCTAAVTVAVGCGNSSGTVVDKLPVSDNMPTPNGTSNGDNQQNNGSDDNQDKPPAEPEPETPTPPEEKVENFVIFVAEDFKISVEYNLGDTSVPEPTAPEKRGYVGKWEDYDLSQGGTITVNAKYELINYSVTFIADETHNVKTYTILDEAVTAPEIPQKNGYTAYWEDFTLTYDEPLTVNAVYDIIYYKIYFPADGETIERLYTVENYDIDEPSVPHKTGYTGEWVYGELTFGEDMTAKAVYTPIPATPDNCFEWQLNSNEDGYVIKSYTGTVVEVVIPSTHDGLPVTEIAKSAFFYKNVGLYGVIIPEGITAIGNSAFSYCSELTSVELPSTLQTIGNDAFSYSGLTRIDLPKNLKKIGLKAFSYSALTEIIIPDSVEEIGDYAFMSCSSLKSAVIGNGLKVIPLQLFANCPALETVNIGAGVETISKGAFESCISLESAVFCDTADWYEHTMPVNEEILKKPAEAAKLLRVTSVELYKLDN